MKFSWQEFKVLQPYKAELLKKIYVDLEDSEYSLEFELVDGALVIWKAVDKTQCIKSPWFYDYHNGWINDSVLPQGLTS